MRLDPQLDDAALLAEAGRQARAWKSDRIAREFWKAAAVTQLMRHGSTRRIASFLIDRIQGSIAAYSNPGVIEEDFRWFGDPSLPVVGYGGFGCVVPPLRFILYTPQINGTLHLNAIYRPGCFTNFEAQVTEVVKDEIRRMHGRLGLAARPASSGGDRP
jgi:hypothetical protein